MQSPITSYLHDLHARIADMRDGSPYLIGPSGTVIDPDHFGIALATVDGYVYQAGDTDHEFSLQSLSKPFSYGMALDDLGIDRVDEKVDVEPSGDAFNELSLAAGTSRPANAMINGGALAVSSLIKGSGGRNAVERILETYSQFAGRPLRNSGRAYQTERRHSDRNHGLAYLLSSVGIIEGRPTTALATYLRQCTVQVNCEDLAMMGATLANGGTNPITGTEVMGIDAVERVLSVMMTSGMYDDAGDWASHVGMPAKSGVGGGIIAVLPGQVGLGVFSPPLDAHGNSVRGVATCRELSRDMEMHFVRSARIGRSAIRAAYSIDREPSALRRTEEAAEVLAEHAHRAMVVELTGDLFFAGTESVVRELSHLDEDVELVVVDVRRVDEVGQVALDMLATVVAQFTDVHRRLLLVDPEDTLRDELPALPTFDSRDDAITYCENALLAKYGAADLRPTNVAVLDSPALAMLDEADVRTLAGLMERRSYSGGEVIRRIGQRFSGVFFILSGQILTILTDADGNRLRVNTLSAGMTFGDLALASDDRQETTIKAHGPVEVMALEAETIDRLELEQPQLAIQLWRALARDAQSRMDRYARAVAARIRD